MVISTTVKHPETGVEFATHACLYEDAVVITTVWQMPGGKGATFRGWIERHGPNTYQVRTLDGTLLPVVFKTRTAALRDTIGLALDLVDLQVAS